MKSTNYRYPIWLTIILVSFNFSGLSYAEGPYFVNDDNSNEPAMPEYRPAFVAPAYANPYAEPSIQASDVSGTTTVTYADTPSPAAPPVGEDFNSLVNSLLGPGALTPQGEEFSLALLDKLKSDEMNFEHLRLMLEIKNGLEAAGLGRINPLDKDDFVFLEQVTGFIELGIREGRDKDRLISSLVNGIQQLTKSWLKGASGWKGIKIDKEGNPFVETALKAPMPLKEQLKAAFSNREALFSFGNDLGLLFGRSSNIPAGYLERYFSPKEVKDIIWVMDIRNWAEEQAPLFDPVTLHMLPLEAFDQILENLAQIKSAKDFLGNQPWDERVKSSLGDLLNLGIGLIPFVGSFRGLIDSQGKNQEERLIVLAGVILDLFTAGEGGNVARTAGRGLIKKEGGEALVRGAVRGNDPDSIRHMVEENMKKTYPYLRGVVLKDQAPPWMLSIENFLSGFNNDKFLTEAYAMIKNNPGGIDKAYVRKWANKLMTDYAQEGYNLRIEFLSSEMIAQRYKGKNVGDVFTVVKEKGKNINRILVHSDSGALEELISLGHEYIHFRVQNGLASFDFSLPENKPSFFRHIIGFEGGFSELVSYQWERFVNSALYNGSRHLTDYYRWNYFIRQGK